MLSSHKNAISSFSSNKSGAGFTLIEVLVATAIFILIMGFGGFMSIDLYRTFVFNTQADNLISLLNLARVKSMSNINQHRHGVKMFGSTYAQFEEGNESASLLIPVDNEIFHNTNFNVMFEQLSGNAVGSSEIQLTDTKRSRVIYINQNGTIE